MSAIYKSGYSLAHLFPPTLQRFLRYYVVTGGVKLLLTEFWDPKVNRSRISYPSPRLTFRSVLCIYSRGAAEEQAASLWISFITQEGR